MLDNYDGILCAALALPPDERAIIAARLLESLNPSNQEIDAAWAEEVEMRIREIDEAGYKLMTARRSWRRCDSEIGDPRGS
jgi:hypothetical protein